LREGCQRTWWESIPLSYIASARLNGEMRKPPKLSDIAQALEYWLVAALLLGSFFAGAWSAIKGALSWL
jgi:hypothetical protein